MQSEHEIICAELAHGEAFQQHRISGQIADHHPFGFVAGVVGHHIAEVGESGNTGEIDHLAAAAGVEITQPVIAAAEDEGIATAAADQQVIAVAAVQEIAAITTFQRIPARVAEQILAAAAAVHLVLAAPALHQVAAAIAEQPVVATFARDIVAAAATADHVAGAAAAQLIVGIVADITAYNPDGAFDVILIDRTLHMLARPSWLKVLKTMLDHVNGNGWLLIADEASNIKDFETVVATHAASWTTDLSRRGYLFLHRC